MPRRLGPPVLVLLLLSLLFSLAVAQRSGQEDYLSPALRGRVEALKADFAKTATNRDNLAARSEAMYDWINAYSLTGNPAPVNATLWLRVNAAALQGTDQEFQEYLKQDIIGQFFDPIIREYILKDEQPEAIGRVTIDDDGPFQAGSWQTIELTYTVAQKSLERGGALLLGKQLMSDQGELQLTDPKADNYVSIRSSNPRVRFTPTTQGLYGMHGGFRGAVPMPAFRVEGGNLAEGDTVTVVYGDRSGGSKGFQVQTFMNDRAILPLYVDLEGKGLFLTPAWPSFGIEGVEAVRVHGIAPSIVEPNEAFDVMVRTEDRYYNRATGAIPAYEVKLDDKKLEPIPAADRGISTIRQVRIAEPGVYRFSFRSTDGKINGISNPVWVRENPPYRLYWGETHAHTGMSEGQGSIDGFYRYGRDEARLDFLGLSEHDIWLDDNEWASMERAVKEYTDPGRFVAFLGYEWTQDRDAGGHHNVFFRNPDGRRRVPTQKFPFLTKLYAGLRNAYDTNDVLIIPHAHTAGDWRLNDPEMERVVEIQSMHGTFEWFGNYYLRNGHQIGFVAASDDHKTRPGYASPGVSGNLTQFGGLAGVYAKEKTPDAIFDAVRARRSYAATAADRIILDVEMAGETMGTRLPMSDERRLSARVRGTAPITEASVVKNGAIVYTKRPSTGVFGSKVTVEVAFESSSEPTGRDNPRPHRPWKGSLEVRGAKLTGARALNFTNPYQEKVEIDGREPNKVNFYTETRGRADKMLLELEEATPSTQIFIRLDAAREVAGSPPMIRPRANLPARTILFPFSRLSDGRAVEEMPFGNGPDLDTVSIELIADDAPLDYDFEYVDNAEPGWGDYYYVRVTQLNGSRAYSSPIWVGGEAPR